jgi:hypothetical protein
MYVIMYVCMYVCMYIVMSLRDVGDVCICMFIYILMCGYIYSQGLIAFRDVVLLSTKVK